MNVTPPQGKDPQAVALANFIDKSHAAGYGDIDPNITVALANGPTNHPMMNSALDSIKNGLGAVASKVGSFWHDHTDNAPRTSAAIANDHFKQTGIKAYAGDDILTVQKKLQDQGYGKNLPLNGVWSADWGNQSYQHVQDQQSKPGIGTFGARKAFDVVFGPLLLSHAIPMIASISKAVAQELVHVTAGVAQPIVDIATGAEFQKSKAGEVTLGDKIGAAIESVNRIMDHQKKQTAEEYMNTPMGAKDYLAAVDAALTISTLGSGAVATKTAFAGAKTAGEQAGGQGIASLFTDLGKDSLGKKNKWLMNSLLPKSIEEDARRFAFTKSFENFPTLNYINGVQKTAATALYNGFEKFRLMAATPYRLPIVGAVGSVLGKTVPLASVKLAVQAHTENFMGHPDLPAAQTLDHLKPIAGWYGASLDLLAQPALHAPTWDINHVSSSVKVGQTVENARAKLADALNQNGIYANWERATDSSRAEIIQKTISQHGVIPENAQALIDSHVNFDFNVKAATNAALAAWSKAAETGKVNPQDADAKYTYIRDMANAIYHNEDALKEAVQSYTLQPGLYAADLSRALYNMESHSTRAYANNLATKLKADEVFSGGKEHLTHLITPETMSKNELRAETPPTPYGWKEKDFTILKNNVEARKKEQLAAWQKATDAGLVGKGKTDSEAIAQLSDANASAAEAKKKLAEFGRIGANGKIKRITPKEIQSAESEIERLKNAGASKSDINLAQKRIDDLVKGRVAQTAFDKARKSATALQKRIDQSKKTIEAGLPGGELSRITAKDVENKLATQEMLDAQTELDKATKALAVARRSLSSLTTKKVPFNIKDAEAKIINGEPTIPSFGYMKIERQTAGDAQKTAMGMFKELEKAKPGFQRPFALDVKRADEDMWAGMDVLPGAPKQVKALPKSYVASEASQAEKALRVKVMKYLGEELNRNIKELQYVPTENLIQLIVEKSHMLPGAATLATDAPAAAQKWIEELNALGYKPVYGTEIGNMFVQPTVMNELGKGLDETAKLADTLGMNFTKIDPKVAAQHSYNETLRTVQHFLDGSKAGEFPAWVTADRTMSFLSKTIDNELNWGLKPVYEFAASKTGGAILHPIKTILKQDRAGYAAEIERLAKEQNISRAEAKARLGGILNPNKGPIFWTRKQVVDALTQVGENGMVKIRNADGSVSEIASAGFSKQAASDFYTAMQKGLRSAPAYSGGFTPIQKMMNSSLGLGNIPMGYNLSRLIDILPNTQRQLMSLRYAGSFHFGYLRVVKSALKGVGSDIPFTMDARGALKELNAEEEALALRNKYLGKDTNREQVTDLINAEFDKRDIFNIYDPQAVESRIIYHLHKNALAEAGGDASKINEAALVKKFHDIYDYGNRTAAEKSVNGVFFPFSFEKTVVRQLGGHMLDDAFVRGMMAAAITFYNSDNGQRAKKWMEENMPLFKEVERFNPFFHGIGAGQFGGIYRQPYEIGKTIAGGAAKELEQFLHMTSPQPITTTDSLNALISFMPAYKDLANMIIGGTSTGNQKYKIGGETRETLDTVGMIAGNLFQNLIGKPKGAWDVKSQLAYKVQQNEGWKMRSQLLTMYGPILHANQSGANYTWPTDTPKVGGLKITSGTIGDLINHVYPEWDQTVILADVAKQKAQVSAEREVMQSKGPGILAKYDAFIKTADQLTSLIARDKIDTGNLVAWTNYMRSQAYELSLSDRSFADFYKKHFQNKFGPLGGI